MPPSSNWYLNPLCRPPPPFVPQVSPKDLAVMANYGLALHKRALQQHANVTKITYDYTKEQCIASYMAAEEALQQVSPHPGESGCAR